MLLNKTFLLFHVAGEMIAAVRIAMEEAPQAMIPQVLTALPLTTATGITRDPQRKTRHPDLRGVNPLREGASGMSTRMETVTRSREEKWRRF